MNIEQHISLQLDRKNIRPSRSRTLIYKYLLENRNHPTVDTIYKALCQELGTLSKTTVYNTLKLFEENGLVWALGIEEHEVRYDADTSPHGHFRCRTCNAVFDFELELENLPIKGLNQFKCEDYQLNITGICKTCNKGL